MNNEYLATFRQHYVAAMAKEMAGPIKIINGLADQLSSEQARTVVASEIKLAALYLRTLADELLEFAQSEPEFLSSKTSLP